MLAGVYFAASACVCAVCFVLYACILPALPFVQHHRKKSRASLQPYRMEPVAPRSAAQHLSSSSDSKHPDGSQLGDEEVGIKPVKHVLISLKLVMEFSLIHEGYADRCLMPPDTTAAAYAILSFPVSSLSCFA